MVRNAHKDDTLVYAIFLRELRHIKNSKRNTKLISFSELTGRFGCLFHMRRRETFELLRHFEKLGFVKLHAYNGVEVV